MRQIRDQIVEAADFPAELRGGALTIGNFDGVHCGHAEIIDRVRAMAQRLGGPAVAFTFDPPPAAILRPEAHPPALTWLDRKAELLAALGLDALIVYPTDTELLSLTAEAFFERIVFRSIAARGLVEGPNFLFGRGRAGDVRRLGELCQAHDIELEIVPPQQRDGEWVSSSRVRQLVQAGDVVHARQLLGRPHRIRGSVVHGAARGAKIGFPTANLAGVEQVLPCPGVYAGWAHAQGSRYAAAIHLGPIPTFQVAQHVVEVHLLGFAGDLYGQPLEVEWLERIRDIRPFPGLDALRNQLTLDIAAARDIAAREIATRVLTGDAITSDQTESAPVIVPPAPPGPPGPPGPPSPPPMPPMAATTQLSTAEAAETPEAAEAAEIAETVKAAESARAAIMVVLDATVRTRADLFERFAEDLVFPAYFGRNWDAFEECLRDLSWLPDSRDIRVIDAGDWLANEPPATRELLATILRETAEYWQSRAGRRRFQFELRSV